MEIALLDAQDIPFTRNFAEGWIASTPSGIGPAIDCDACMSGVHDVIASGRGDALVLLDGDEMVGLLCVEYGSPGFSLERIAREKYFFVRPDHRGKWTVKLHRAAEELAVNNGCKFIIFTVSVQAGGEPDRIGGYFHRMGYHPLEQTFIKEIH